MFRNQGLKSTEQKLERQAKCDNQIAFYENQKENLKSMKCDTVEEISRKLELFHTYEDEIAAAKAAYNNEQMFHILDEAEEMGEKIARHAEKMEPKTPEERREEALEEILGTEESDGVLEELLEETGETLEELEEKSEDELEEKTGETLEELEEPLAQEELEESAVLVEECLEEIQGENDVLAEAPLETIWEKAAAEQAKNPRDVYRPFDARI